MVRGNLGITLHRVEGRVGTGLRLGRPSTVEVLQHVWEAQPWPRDTPNQWK